MNQDLAEILFTEEQIAKRVEELAKEITAFYEGQGVKEIVVIGILRGSFVFMADLVRKIPLKQVIDFMAISSYGSGTISSGTVRVLRDVAENIAGKHVLIVEDIIDTGITLNSLREILWSKNPESLCLCTFLNKPSRRQIDAHIDFCGYDVPDAFLVGYGLDYDGLYRELPVVAVLAPHVYNK